MCCYYIIVIEWLLKNPGFFGFRILKFSAPFEFSSFLISYKKNIPPIYWVGICGGTYPEATLKNHLGHKEEKFSCCCCPRENFYFGTNVTFFFYSIILQDMNLKIPRMMLTSMKKKFKIWDVWQPSCLVASFKNNNVGNWICAILEGRFEKTTKVPWNLHWCEWLPRSNNFFLCLKEKKGGFVFVCCYKYVQIIVCGMYIMLRIF